VVVADLDEAGAGQVAGELGGAAEARWVDVGDETALADLVRGVLDRHGRIDLFCSNAGIGTGTGLDTTAEDWQRTWAVNVMSHVYGARAVLPSMVDRGEGYLLLTCSAAGLLTAVGDAPYTITKHAAVGFAEWLAVMYADHGVRVSALCPLGVDTPMLRAGVSAGHLLAKATSTNAILSAEAVADATVAGIAEERFLILPHPEVADYWKHKASDPDGWLSSLRDVIRPLAAS